MKALGYEVTTGVGRTGVARAGTAPGPTVMLRTELTHCRSPRRRASIRQHVDRQEPRGVDDAVMHACGHDLHMAAWTGDREVDDRASASGGTVRSCWSVSRRKKRRQRRAVAMLKDGLFTRFPRPDYVLAHPRRRHDAAGIIGLSRRPISCDVDLADDNALRPRRPGAMPYNTVDPVGYAARTVMALQTVVSRENNPMDPVVVTIGSIHGGTQANIIPDEVRLQLSVRTYTTEIRQRTLDAIRRIAKGEALAAGAPREPKVDAPAVASAPVYNDPALTLRLADALKHQLGEKNVVEMPLKMTSEDFAEYGVAGVRSVLLHISTSRHRSWRPHNSPAFLSRPRTRPNGRRI